MVRLLGHMIVDPAGGAKGTSLLLVERGMAGFEKGQRLKKLGLKAQDTSELFFDNVRVPAANLLGGEALENRGFVCLMEQLPWERIQIAVTAVAAAQAAIDWTVQYVKERRVFGQPVAAFQNTRYTLAELQTEVQVARVFVDKCLELVGDYRFVAVLNKDSRGVAAVRCYALRSDRPEASKEVYVSPPSTESIISVSHIVRSTSGKTAVHSIRTMVPGINIAPAFGEISLA